MLVFADRVQETTTTSGTGTIDLAGPTEGRRGFSTIGSGNRCRYLIIASSGAWEVGEGTFTSGSPNTLTRSFINSSTGSLLSLPVGTHYVSLTADADSFNSFERFELKTVSTNTTIEKGDHALVTTAGTTVTLPASPEEGCSVLISVLSFSNTVVGRNAQPIMGLAENMTIDVENTSIKLRYTDATRGWVLV